MLLSTETKRTCLAIRQEITGKPLSTATDMVCTVGSAGCGLGISVKVDAGCQKF